MSTPANSINESTTGITGFTGTAFTGTAATQYNVLVGGSTSSTISNIAPSATSGVPVISQGAAANPTFGTAVVAGGGTGAVTLTGVLTGNGTSAITANTVTQHGVLLGGATNAVSSLGVASTGQTLMGSTGADPSFTGSPSFSGSVTAGTTITASSGNITATSGDLALPTTSSTVGRVLINGTPVLHTFGPTSTFVGASAGNFTQSVGVNVGVGTNALHAVSSGQQNVAVGNSALAALSTSSINTAVGYNCMSSVSTGNGKNCGFGPSTLDNLTTGVGCTAMGYVAGADYTSTESYNISLGYSAGYSGANTFTGESNTCRIGSGTGSGTGNLNKVVFAGIQTITVTGTAVLVSTTDQLGVAVSSRKYKENIQDMGDTSSALLKLRPVTFTLKDYSDKSIQYGLIAEEVAEIMPSIVVNDKNGEPQTVQYHVMPALLLNELQKAVKRIEVLEAKLAAKN